MSKFDKIMFTIFVIFVQIIQFSLVYLIAWLNSHVIEFLFIFLSFQFNRKIFGNSYHAEKLSKCTLLTISVFYLLIKAVPSINISIFAPILFGLYLSFALNYVQELIDNQQVPKIFVKKQLREQVLDILDGRITEEEIENFCINKGINLKISETVYLYLSNSKYDVADLLDVAPATVINRVKRFIEKATE